MNGSWFFDKNFTGVPDDFFDDALKYLDLPMEDVETNDAGEDWDAQFQHLVPPGFIYDENSSDTKVNNCTQSSQPKQRLSPGEESSKSSMPLYYDSSEGKYSRPLWTTSSPVSVLESSSSSSSAENPKAYHPKLDIPVKRPRSKRPRPQRRAYPFIPITLLSESYSDDTIAKKNQPKRRNPTHLQKPPETRKCTHCEVTKTPQWREGPMGPKTLCNACGVRYRSGRLFPEYRPAASPTFVPTVHSNSHRKVIEMRKSGWQVKSPDSESRFLA